MQLSRSNRSSLGPVKGASIACPSLTFMPLTKVLKLEILSVEICLDARVCTAAAAAAAAVSLAPDTTRIASTGHAGP